MYIKQIFAYIENRPGRLEEFIRVLSDAGIDLVGISLADTTDFGILRAIVDKTDLAVEKLREHGISANVTNVLAAAVPDAPGGLAGALALLRENGISVEYLYSLVRRISDAAVIILKVDRPDEAAALLAEKGARLLGQEDIAADGR